MITCKDGHVMATGRGPELMEDIGAIAAALTEDGRYDRRSRWLRNGAGSHARKGGKVDG